MAATENPAPCEAAAADSEAPQAPAEPVPSRRFYLSIGNGKNIGAITREAMCSWDDVFATFNKPPPVAAKGGSGWHVFGRFSNRHRSNDDLIFRSAITVDMEAQEPDADVDAALEELKRRVQGCKALYHTTHSHDVEKGEKRYRVVIPLAEDVTAEEYRAGAAALISGLEGSVDPRSVSPVQCSYLPAVPHDGGFYGCWPMPGDRFYSLSDAAAAEADGRSAIAGNVQQRIAFPLGDAAAGPVLVQEAGAEPQPVIREGQRNDHMSAYALKVLKRHGDKGTTAEEMFTDELKRCHPPLPGLEIQSIWDSALAAYQKKVLTAPGYIKPELYGGTSSGELSDLTGVALSNLFARDYREEMRYSKALGWLAWDGEVWRASGLAAQEAMKGLTARVLDDANGRLIQAHTLLGEAKASGEDEAAANKEVAAAKKYQQFALRTREASRVQGALTLARSAMQIRVEECDSDPYLLNTPGGIVDLNSGETGPHDPAEHCVKITGYAPADTAHSELWDGFLDTVTQRDKELQRYIQTIAGAALLGRVYTESIVIAHGSGANGKSTLFNAFYAVLGSYAGKVPAEALVTSRGTSHKNTLAELLGKRLVIASETEEGQRFSNAMLKMLASTDPITAERKYGDPFVFLPSHLLVLYTNFLPKVSGSDHGTWRRIAVVPFNATITDPQPDFLERLLEDSGGVILRWMAEGAGMYIAAGRRLPPCGAVEAATAKYKEDNDWLSQFLDENCETGDTLSVGAGELYDSYHQCTKAASGYARSPRDFKAAMTERGFEHHKDKRGAFWLGLCLRDVHQWARGDG
jgi:P4 family phage/plasmid primase-like protien